MLHPVRRARRVARGRRLRARAQRHSGDRQPPRPWSDRLRPGRRSSLLAPRRRAHAGRADRGARLVSLSTSIRISQNCCISASNSSTATSRPMCASTRSILRASRSSTPAGSTPRASSASGRPRPGANKFTTRVLTKGTYYVLVDACQPDYQLRTKLFDPPPYLKREEAGDPTGIADAARKAVRTAMDFQLLAGDSWHANTPRKGQAMDRVANVHHETSTCVGCHADPLHDPVGPGGRRRRLPGSSSRLPLQFLFERLANNPVPLHGHDRGRLGPDDPRAGERAGTALDDPHGRGRPAQRSPTATTPPRPSPSSSSSTTTAARPSRPTRPTGTIPSAATRSPPTPGGSSIWSFRRTGDARFAATRDLVARLLPTGKPDNVRDLAAQTIGLCLI